MPTPRRLLVDLDETVFPFAHAYDEWLRRSHGQGLAWEGVPRYDLDAAVGDRDHNTLAEQFLLDPATLLTAPIPEAAEALAALEQREWEIWVVTARFAQAETDATRAWVQRHLPAAHGRVILTRSHHDGPKIPKADLVWALGAHALVDDYHANFEGLPDHAHGLLVRRPFDLPSDSPTHPRVVELHWRDVVDHLDRHV